MKLFIILLLFSSFSWAQYAASSGDVSYSWTDGAGEGDESTTSVVSSGDELVSQVLEKMPESDLKEGLKTYLEIIGAESYYSDLSVGDSNVGVSAYLENIFYENDCFGHMAEDFYRAIQDIDAGVAMRQNAETEDGYALDRANLLSESGKGVRDALNPGWLWELAMKTSGGNANIAMRLIALCGHDDVAQGAYTIHKPMTEDKRKELIAGIEREIFQLEDLLYQLESDPDSFFGEEGISAEEISSTKDYYHQDIIILRDKIEEYKTASTYDDRMLCPAQNSNFYQNKALDEKAYIGDRYRDKLIDTYSIDADARNIASKNYHIYAAAFMSCQLIEKGVGPLVAAQVQKAAAWLYRTIRMQSVVDMAEHFEIIQQAYHDYSDNGGRKNIVDFIYECRDNDYSAECITIMPYFEGAGDYDIFGMPTITRESIEDELRKYDAAFLLSKWGLGGEKVFGHTLPHTNIKMTGPLFKQRMRRGHFDNDKERLDRAYEKMETYLADWDWTVRQHGIGAWFGAKNCEELDLGNNFDDLACEQFEKGALCDCTTRCYMGQAEEFQKILDAFKEEYVDSENFFFEGTQQDMAQLLQFHTDSNQGWY